MFSAAAPLLFIVIPAKAGIHFSGNTDRFRVAAPVGPGLRRGDEFRKTT
jgi:hypothetical protein